MCIIEYWHGGAQYVRSVIMIKAVDSGETMKT